MIEEKEVTILPVEVVVYELLLYKQAHTPRVCNYKNQVTKNQLKIRNNMRNSITLKYLCKIINHRIYGELCRFYKYEGVIEMIDTEIIRWCLKITRIPTFI